MSYQLDNRQKRIFDKRKEKLYSELNVCKLVKHTLDTEGWRRIIEPILDRMIIDTIGGKVNDRWVSGSLDKARKDERREFYIGYKQALIQLHNNIYNYIRQIEIKEGQLEDIERQEKEGFKTPMLEKEEVYG